VSAPQPNSTDRPPKQADPDPRRSPEPVAAEHPAETARRELIEWCERHGLPVPAERPGAPH
jgi:hypothetical protein